MQSLGRYSRRFLLFRKTQSIQFSRTLTSAKLNDTLHSRVMAVENKFLWRVKVTPVLDDWLKQSKHINPTDLRTVIKALSESQRFDHALQVSEWITKRGVFEITTEDVASRLYLVEINSGLTEAEKLFNSLPENMKDDSVYTTLLSFYTKSKNTRHDAEATYQKMGELNLLSKPYPYYKMISLYGLLGETNMVEDILRQMEENGVVHDKSLTDNNVLKAYASVPDVKAMDKYLKRIEDETPSFEMALQTGISMAKAYLECGSSKEAIEMLRRTERVVDGKSKYAANKVLMEMYGEAGAKQDESRFYRRINPNAKQGQRMRACRSKGCRARSSFHQVHYYGGCGGGCSGSDHDRGSGDGSRADDDGGGVGADDDGGGVGADIEGGSGGGCGGGGCGSWGLE